VRLTALASLQRRLVAIESSIASARPLIVYLRDVLSNGPVLRVTGPQARSWTPRMPGETDDALKARVIADTASIDVSGDMPRTRLLHEHRRDGSAEWGSAMKDALARGECDRAPRPPSLPSPDERTA